MGCTQRTGAQKPRVFVQHTGNVRSAHYSKSTKSAAKHACSVILSRFVRHVSVSSFSECLPSPPPVHTRPAVWRTSTPDAVPIIAPSVPPDVDDISSELKCCMIFTFRLNSGHGTDRQMGCNAQCALLGEGHIVTPITILNYHTSDTNNYITNAVCDPDQNDRK